MAAAPQCLTVDDFERQYGHENGWEYWFGEAVQKPTTTWAHSILQQLIAELIRQAGYVTGPEVDLRATPDCRPRLDVSGVLKREGRYSRTLAIAIEILSDEGGRYILEKCRNYEKVGIRQVFVLDPESHRIYEWNKGLVERTDLSLANGVTISSETIWQEFDRRMNS
jgi:Uma2 family endonuclease